MKSDIYDALKQLLGDNFEEVTIDVGECVICDYCGLDCSESPQSGGFLFGSYACCPNCADDMLATIRKYGEEDRIQATCPNNVSFANWVRSLR